MPDAKSAEVSVKQKMHMQIRHTWICLQANQMQWLHQQNAVSYRRGVDMSKGAMCMAG